MPGRPRCRFLQQHRAEAAMSQTTIDPRLLRAPPKRKLRLSWADERVRGLVWQVLVVGVVGAVFYWLWSNTVHNLEVRRIATGFGFLSREAGLPIGEIADRVQPDRHLPAGADWSALLNTLKVAVVGIVLATVLGTAGRHRAAVAQLAAVEDRRRLCRGDPRPAAAAAAAVLVRDHAGAARAAAGAEPGRGRVPVQPRPASCPGWSGRTRTAARCWPSSRASSAPGSGRGGPCALRMQDGQPRPVWPVALALLVGLPLVVWLALRRALDGGLAGAARLQLPRRPHR